MNEPLNQPLDEPDAADPFDGGAPASRRNPLWVIFFCFYVLELAIGPYVFIHQGVMPLRLLTIQTLFELIGAIGYLCFLCSWRFMSWPFWITYIGIWTMRWLLAGRLFLRALTLYEWQGSRENYVSLIGLGSLLFNLPVLAALVLYTWRSPEIWGRSVSRR